MTFDPSESKQAVSPRTRWLTVGALAILQLACLRWASRVAIAEMTNCQVCDTSYYLSSANELVHSGLLFTNAFDGYRSYFVPFVVSALQKASSFVGYAVTDPERYAYGASSLFWLLSVSVMWWLSNRVSLKQFLFSAAATLVNPFLVVYVPFALQEGVLITLCLPFLFVWVGATNLGTSVRAAVVLIMALVAYITRAALVWWLVPAVLYSAWMLRPQMSQTRRRLPPIALVGFAGALLLGPQIYIAKHKFDSFNPYPATSLFASQISWGVSLLKYASVEDEGHWRGLTYFSPFVAEPEEVKTINFYLDNPTRGAFLLFSHAYAGFHYDQIMPYWRLEGARALTFWLVLSSAIVFLGVTQMVITGLAGRVSADDMFSIATMVLCCLSLVLVATESRFGIVGFAMLSIHALKLLATRLTRDRWGLVLTGLVLYLVLAFLFNTLLMQNADINL